MSTSVVCVDQAFIGNFSGLKIVSSIVQTVKINFVLQQLRKRNKFNWNLYLWSFQKKNFSLIFLAHKKRGWCGKIDDFSAANHSTQHNKNRLKRQKAFVLESWTKKLSHCWARLCWTYVITSGGNDEVWNHETFREIAFCSLIDHEMKK